MTQADERDLILQKYRPKRLVRSKLHVLTIKANLSKPLVKNLKEKSGLNFNYLETTFLYLEFQNAISSTTFEIFESFWFQSLQNLFFFQW